MSLSGRQHGSVAAGCPVSGRAGGALARLRPRRRGRPWPAFTLVEMMVSLAVLTLALGVVGIVFTVTTRTASQAAAYSETLNWVRQFTLQIKEDLARCEPASSFLVLVGRKLPAALTQADLEAGLFYRVLIGDPADVPAGYDPKLSATEQWPYSNPRADLLMFLSNRAVASAAPPDAAGNRYAEGGRFAPILAVYGHAALGEPVWVPSSGYQFPTNERLRHIEETISSGGHTLSRIPANRWHLSRRATIIENVVAPKYTFGVSGQYGDEWQRITRCEPTRPGASRAFAGDVAALNLDEFLADLGPGSMAVPGQIREWGPAILSPYDADAAGSWWALRTRINGLLYNRGDTRLHHVATVLTELPVELRSNLGVHMLPGCAWFQVEFLMPEDPRNSLDYSDPTPDDPDDWSTAADMPRWTTVEPGTMYVFVPDTQANRDAVGKQLIGTGEPDPNGRLATFAKLDPRIDDRASAVSNRRVRMWPYAIRITVRVFDPRGRLAEPIVRTIVHRFE